MHRKTLTVRAGRWAVGPLAMSLALAGWCAPSEAGYWKLSFRETSTGTLPPAEDHNPEGGVVGWGTPSMGSLSGSNEVSIVLEWQPWHEEDTSLPDEEIRLRVTSGAYGMSTIWDGQTTVAGGAVSASNLWAAPAIETGIGKVTSHSHNLVVVANPTRATRLELPARSMSASAHYPGTPPGTTVLQTAGYYASLARDNRAVKLTRPGAVGEITTIENGVPVTYGRSIFSRNKWTKETAGTFDIKPEPNLLRFEGKLEGSNWATTLGNLNYNVVRSFVISDQSLLATSENDPNIQPDTETHENSSDNTDYITRYGAFGHLARAVNPATPNKQTWIREPVTLNPTVEGFTEYVTAKLEDRKPPFPNLKSPRTPETVTVKYFAKDNADGALAEARYHLTLHEPYEKVSDERLLPDKIEVGPLYVPIDPANPTGNWGPIKRYGAMPAGNISIQSAIVRSKGYAVGVGSDLSAIAEIFSLAFSITGERTSEFTREVAVAQEVSWPELLEGEVAWVTQQTVFDRRLAKYRRYDANGEIRSAGSPTLPAPSVPYEFRYQIPNVPTLGVKSGKIDDIGSPPVEVADNPIVSTETF